MADDLSPAEMRVVRAVLGGQKLQFALKKFLPGTKSKTPAYNRIWRKCKTAEREQEQKKGNQRTCCFVLVMLSQNCNSTHTHTHTHTQTHTCTRAHTNYSASVLTKIRERVLFEEGSQQCRNGKGKSGF